MQSIQGLAHIDRTTVQMDPHRAFREEHQPRTRWSTRLPPRSSLSSRREAAPEASTPQVDKGRLRYWRLCLRRSARRGGECLPALKARNADDSRAQNAATLSPLMPGGRARSATPPHKPAATCSCVRLPWVSPQVLNWEASVYGGKGEGKNAAELPLASRKQETPAFSGVSAR